ncbi:hypothetical protein RJ491_005424 [Pluralibacter gergoviae]|nr:hypothetical protein [Pluralibacter gergoviae]ELD4319510.1 hypothetical protein [Pluralibacter gergoviae]
MIFRQVWSFDLYRVGDEYILTVIFSEHNHYAQMDILRSFKMKKDLLIKIYSFQDFLKVADEIRNNYPVIIYDEVNPHVFISGKNVKPQHVNLNDVFVFE